MKYFPAFSEAFDSQELSAVEQKAPGTDGDALSFGHLDGRRFEILTYRLKCLEFAEKGCRVLLMQGVGERGRDIIVFDASGHLIQVVQCKNHQDRLSLPELRRELVKLLLHNHLDSSILAGRNIDYELWCPGGLSEPAATLLGGWPSGWTVEELAEDAATVIAENAAFKDLDWSAVGPNALAAFAVRPSQVHAIDISTRLRACAPIYESYFQTKVVLDRATAYADIKQIVENANSLAKEQVEEAKARATEALRQAELHKDRAAEAIHRSEQLSLTMAVRATEASLAGRLEQARTDFAQVASGATHAAALFLAFFFYYRIGDVWAADGVLRQMLQQANVDPRLLAVARVASGQLQHHRGDFAGAEKSFQEALRLFEQLGDSAGIAGTCSEWGLLFAARGEPVKALELQERALGLSRTMGHLIGVATEYTNIGATYKARGELERARQMYGRALALHMALSDVEGIANNYSNIAMVEKLRGRVRAAEFLHRRALSIFQRIGNRKHAAIQYGALATIRKDLGEYVKAEALHRQALALDEAIESAEGIARDLGNLGAIRAKLGDFAGAEELGLRSLELDERTGNRRGIASQYGNLAVVSLGRGDLDKAESWQQRAIALFDACGDKNGVALNRGNLAHIHMKRADTSKALEMFRAALDGFTEIGNREGVAHSLESLGHCHLVRKEADAVAMLEKAVQAYETLEAPQRRRSALLLLALAFVTAERLDEAEATISRAGALPANEDDRLAFVCSDLAGAYWRRGDRARSTLIYRRVLEATLLPHHDTDGVAKLAATAHRMIGYALIERAESEQNIGAEILDEACGHYEQSIGQGPNDAERYEVLLLWAVALGMRAELSSEIQARELLPVACEKCAAAAALRRGDWRALDLYGEILSALARRTPGLEADARYAEAIEQFGAALRLDPTCFEPAYHLGDTLAAMAHAKEGEPSDALRRRACDAFEAAHKIRPEDAANIQAWARTLVELAESAASALRDELFAAAFEKMAMVERLAPENSEVLVEWGWALLGQARSGALAPSDGALEMAASKFDAALAKKAENGDALFGLGCVLLAKARGEEARNLLHQAEARMTALEAIDPPFGAYGLACVYSRLGNEEECRKKLVQVRDAGRLGEREDVAAELDLAPMATKPWFAALFE